ncbi:MAG TPA: beta-propeller fold lactonase family protein [Xanthobacteraceae bacterium]|nr:beta-propeller fold lactonase family protein [Xanthobacteraceae bacterium]
MPKTVYYASIGPKLCLYDVDADGAQLSKRGSVTLPANIQYAWPHPSRRYLYVVSSNGGPGLTGDKHYANALLMDPATGALRHHGTAAVLPSRPIHVSVDASGGYLLTAYNDPSSITVHRLDGDGTIGAAVAQPANLDTGIYAHQILETPSSGSVTLVTRGNDAKAGRAEDPGAIKTFAFSKGVLGNLASIAPNNGLGFGPRHLDFHPTKPWVFVSIERQNKLYVYGLSSATGLSSEPMFVKDTLSDRKPMMRQAAGAIHVHPTGRFVYVTNRASDRSSFEGKAAVIGGKNNVAVFTIDQSTGEPTLIQNADGNSVELRTFGIDPSGRLLVAASIATAPVLEENRIVSVPAGLSVFHIADNGELTFVRKYDVDTGDQRQFWSGMVTLP